jgi:hypothetical protein
MSGRNDFKRSLKIGERFDVVDLGGLNQIRDAALCSATLVITGEQPWHAPAFWAEH